MDVIDAAGMIVMPGFIDTHRHMWQGALRNILPNGLLSDYTRDITGTARALFRPEDARIGDLVSALGAINAGVTTCLDWSHIGNSPAHADAAIDGLRESGIRARLSALLGPASRPASAGCASKYFSSNDQLLTLAMATGESPTRLGGGTSVGASITLHAGGSLAGVRERARARTSPTSTARRSPTARGSASPDSGGHVSIAAPIEMEMGHGVPPIQAALDHGIRPSLSVDVETQMPGDMFTQMRTVFTLQRMQALARQRAGEANPPALLTVREVVEFATIAGARANRLERQRRHADAGQARRHRHAAHRRDQRAAAQQRLRRRRARHGHEQRRHGVHGGMMKKQAGRLVGVDVARVRPTRVARLHCLESRLATHGAGRVSARSLSTGAAGRSNRPHPPASRRCPVLATARGQLMRARMKRCGGSSTGSPLSVI